jgi:hypothetical protein
MGVGNDFGWQGCVLRVAPEDMVDHLQVLGHKLEHNRFSNFLLLQNTPHYGWAFEQNQ